MTVHCGPNGVLIIEVPQYRTVQDSKGSGLSKVRIKSPVCATNTQVYVRTYVCMYILTYLGQMSYM